MKAISRELGLGVYMSNKEELLEAIEHYSVFTKTQRKMLKFLVQIETDSKSVIDVRTLAKAANTSATAVYKAIKLFEKDGILQVVTSSNNKMNNFLLKKARLEEIKEIGSKISSIG